MRSIDEGTNMRKPAIGLLATAGFGVAILLLLSMAFLVRGYLRQFQVVGDAVRHTNDVIERLNDTTSSLGDLRPAERSFLATRNPVYRAQFEEDVRAVRDGYRQAQSLTRDNPPQRERAARLLVLADKAIAYATADLVTAETRRPRLAGAPRDEQRETVRELIAMTHQMIAEENQLLNLRRSTARSALRRTTTSVLLAMALALALVMLSTWATVANISRRKHAQREQERLQQLLDLQAAREVNAQFQERIIAVLGHDLRNPLTAILMGSHALSQSPSEETKAILVRRILSSAQRMRRMIDQLLDFTRSRHAGIRVAPAPTDIACVVRRVLDELEMANPKRALRLNVDGVTMGEWDADRLEQVISNLAGNAIRYGDAATEIDVALKGGAEQITIAVHNSGAPIAPELLPLIFDPFRRGTNHGTDGLGLGLFITREIVQAHGGTIAVASTPTDGTTFSVVLPRHASV